MELVFFTLGGWCTGFLFGLLVKSFIIDRAHPDSNPFPFAQKSGYYVAAFCLVIRLIEFIV